MVAENSKWNDFEIILNDFEISKWNDQDSTYFSEGTYDCLYVSQESPN